MDRGVGLRLLAVAFLAALILFGTSGQNRPLVLWNHSRSIPVGLYVRTTSPIGIGAIVTVRAVDVAPAASHARSFASPRDRFIKRVAAVQGDTVCAIGDRLTINHAITAQRRTVDRAGLRLDGWKGCRTLRASDVLLLGDTSDSYDGRYWGPTDRRVIDGVWRPFLF